MTERIWKTIICQYFYGPETLLQEKTMHCFHDLGSCYIVMKYELFQYSAQFGLVQYQPNFLRPRHLRYVPDRLVIFRQNESHIHVITVLSQLSV